MFDNGQPTKSSQIDVHSVSGERAQIGCMLVLEPELEPLRGDLTASLHRGLFQNNHTPELTSRPIGN